MFLVFDASEDDQGCPCFDALACVRSDQLAAVRAEIDSVLAWAHTAFPGMLAPLDEGGEWDVDLQQWLDGPADEAAPPWHSLSLSLSGSPQFGAAFRQRFLPA